LGEASEPVGREWVNKGKEITDSKKRKVLIGVTRK